MGLWGRNARSGSDGEGSNVTPHVTPRVSLPRAQVTNYDNRVTCVVTSDTRVTILSLAVSQVTLLYFFVTAVLASDM